MTGNQQDSDPAPTPPQLPEVDSPPAEDILDGVPSVEEILGDARPVGEVVGEQPSTGDVVDDADERLDGT